MKYFTISFLLVMMSWMNGHAQKQIKVVSVVPQKPVSSNAIPTPVDSVSTLTDGSLAQMPTMKFAPEAKILVWQPHDGVHYFMPNILKTHLIEQAKGKIVKPQDVKKSKSLNY